MRTVCSFYPELYFVRAIHPPSHTNKMTYNRLTLSTMTGTYTMTLSLFILATIVFVMELVRHPQKRMVVAKTQRYYVVDLHGDVKHQLEELEMIMRKQDCSIRISGTTSSIHSSEL